MLYIINCELEKNGPGISRKIEEQVNVFNKAGLNCSLYTMPYYENEESIKTKIIKRLPFSFNLHKHWEIDDIKNEDVLYIRRLGIWDREAVRFFQTLKKSNPQMKIVLEISTYPYDGETKRNWKGYPLLWKDIYNRRHIYTFVDRIATLSDDKEIFGIPTVAIGNGIDIDKIRPREIIVRNEDTIHCIAVALFEWWHGYDRFIEGMKSYYASNPRRKVIFHLVGNGREFLRYQKMVADYGLGDYVILHGQQTGEALDAIYDQCNLGIASLGCYRKGLNGTQELKSREYLAKGLPFIGSVKITDIPEVDRDNIYLQVPNNDSPVDIKAVLNFYDRIYSESAEQVNNRLRQFAKDHFSMEVAMKEVIDFFKSGK